MANNPVSAKCTVKISITAAKIFVIFYVVAYLYISPQILEGSRLKDRMSESGSMQPTILGWREWVSLPGLGINHIKAKVDTGARTSALHAFKIKKVKSDSAKKRIRVWIHPLQRSTEEEIVIDVDLLDRRVISDSGGHKEERYVIKTPVQIGAREIPIELTLTNRDTMGFRMLLGRTALRNGFLVNPRKSFLLGKPEPQK